MTQEDKQLLLVDLCARLPYGVKVSVNGGKEPWTLKGMFEGEHTGMMLILEPLFPSKDVSPQTSNWQLSQCNPYLRPMSSMTTEELEVLNKLLHTDYHFITLHRCNTIIRWLNKNMFDFNELIPKGLALSTEEFKFNPYKNQ